MRCATSRINCAPCEIPRLGTSVCFDIPRRSRRFLFILGLSRKCFLPQRTVPQAIPVRVSVRHFSRLAPANRHALDTPSPSPSRNLVHLTMGAEASKTHAQNELASVDIGDGVHVSTLCRNGKLMELGPDDPKTSYEAFQCGQKVSNNGPFLGTRNKDTGEYEWLRFSEVSAFSTAFGSGMVSACGQRPSNRTHVGLFSQNRWEWYVTDQACARFSMVPVPIYSTLGEEAMVHIVSQADLKLIVCDTPARAVQLVEMDLEALRCLVVMDPVPPEAREKIEARVKLFTFQEVIEEGRVNPQELCPVQPDDICTISYTSGTTGVPKGVVLTHQALCLSVVSTLHLIAQKGQNFGPDDVTLSYLPAAHVYERLSMISMSICGSRIGYFSGDLTKLLDDARKLQPTIFTAVPRILYKVYDAVHSEAAKSYIKATMLQWATQSKMASLQVGQLRSDTVWDSLVFQKVRDIFGGRVRHLTTGSAAVSVEVLNFFRIALSCCIYNGYGQTESGGVTAMTFPYDFRSDHVGGPIPSVQVKLVDFPELGYFTSEGFGEVCVKGANLFREYYMMPDQTASTLDSEGWLHTGDIGSWTLQGNLQIVDRCKMIFKLSHGEYIAPDRVEGIMQRCPHLAQVFIDGKSDKDYLVAIVVPDFDVVAKTLGVKPAEMDKEKVCMDPELRKKILDEIDTTGRAGGLKGFELAKRIYLHPEPFSVENGLLTATMKSKRNELRKRFSKEVAALYNE